MLGGRELVVTKHGKMTVALVAAPTAREALITQLADRDIDLAQLVEQTDQPDATSVWAWQPWHHASRRLGHLGPR